MSQPAAGRIIGRYQLVQQIGSGGMGEIYLARDPQNGHLIALKVLHEHRASDRRALSRFLREARALSGVHHPNVVAIHEIGQANANGGIPFIAMEFVSGSTLAGMRGREPDITRCLQILEQAALALAAVHAEGVVHRDIKPENLMLDANGQLKLLDFGLARFESAGGPAGDAITAVLTRPGDLVGTIPYMSPEQLRAEQELDGASDIFSLGLVIYELATGAHPFLAASEASVQKSILADRPIDPCERNPAIPPALQALILRMLDKDPRGRPGAAEIARDVREWREQPAGSGSPVGGKRRPTQPQAHFVGRGPERSQVSVHLDDASRGRAVLLCIGGEAGIGKTTLIDECLSGRDEFLVARGKCSEQLSKTDAYLPVLEALEAMLRSPAASSVDRLLKAVAQSWYARIAPRAAGGVSGDASDARSPDRLKHEFFTFLSQLAKQKPVVLFIEDLHWADESTVDLLAYVTTRCEGLPVALIVTYRNDELKLFQKGFASLMLELQRRHLCRELTLRFLTLGDVESYLAAKYPLHEFSQEFIDVVHRRTKGNPLFLTELLLDLENRGWLALQDNSWQVTQQLTEIELHLPESTGAVIERKIGRLSETQHLLLEAAAVEGMEFDSVTVATALGATWNTEAVEEALNALADVHGLVTFVRDDDFPDKSGTSRYQFAHVLYREALYPTLARARRERLSLTIAQALSDRYGAQAGAIAPKLALLFENGRHWQLAVKYYSEGAKSSLHLAACHATEALARRGLRLLVELPPGEERDRFELSLRMPLGSALMALRTYGDPEVEVCYRRAYDLVATLKRELDHFSVMYTGWAVQIMKSVRGMGLDLGQQLLAYAEQNNDPALIVQAGLALGFSLIQLGDFQRAAVLFERAVAVQNAGPPNPRTGLFPLDYGVGCRAQLAMAYWYLGHPDRAVICASEAVDLAEHLGDAYSLAFALMYRAGVHQLRREPEAVMGLSTRAVKIAEEQKYEELRRWSSLRHGWAAAALGDTGGIAEMQAALRASREAGSLAARPHFLSLLADSLLQGGRYEEGMSVISEALDLIQDSESRGFEAEALRLRAEFAFRLGIADLDEVRGIALHAISVAQSQSCRGLELRAALTLARLLREGGDDSAARPLLEQVLDGFTEGLGTPDLVAARQFLESPPQ